MNAEALDLHALKREHGGQVYDGGRRWKGPGPGHSRHDSSLSVVLTDDGKPLVHSFAGDPFRTCAAYLGLEHAAPERLDRASLERRQRQREVERAERERTVQAFCTRFWGGGVKLEGSPGARYLQARAIGWFPADLAYHPAAPRGYTTAATAPAILALARSITGAPRAVQATYLTPDHRAKTHRITFGAILGATVRLSPVGETLAVAEGMETAASFAKFQSYPTWATLGTANLEAFRPPATVRKLIIAADGDPGGQKAAYTLAAKLRTRCDVVIMSAPEGADWNDVVSGGVHV